MDPEQLRLILWLVSGFLMAAGTLGVLLAVLLDRRSAPPASEATRTRSHPGAQVAAVAEAAPAEPVDAEAMASRRAAYRQGLLVLIGLAVLTALEFWIATAAGGSTVFLFIIALAKAGIIVQYYMHLNQVWGGEEGHP